MTFNLAGSCFKEKGLGDELEPSHKLLLVLMRLCYNFPQNNLACRFNIEQSRVSYLESVDTNAESSTEGTY